MWTSQSQIIVWFCVFFQIHLSSLCSLRCEVYTLPSDALYANCCRGFLRAASPPGRFRKQPEHRFRAKVQHLFFSFNIRQQQIKNLSYLFFALTAPSNKLNACVISLWPFCVFLHPPKTSLPPAGRASERRSTCAVMNRINRIRRGSTASLSALFPRKTNLLWCRSFAHGLFYFPSTSTKELVGVRRRCFPSKVKAWDLRAAPSCHWVTGSWKTNLTHSCRCCRVGLRHGGRRCLLVLLSKTGDVGSERV